MKRKRRLPPYQYKLRFPPIEKPKVIHRQLPYLVFFDGKWHIFKNKWKSRFRGPSPWWASCISAPTIRELQTKMMKSCDGWKFGANEIRGYSNVKDADIRRHR